MSAPDVLFHWELLCNIRSLIFTVKPLRRAARKTPEHCALMGNAEIGADCWSEDEVIDGAGGILSAFKLSAAVFR
jgi:hypothetical protein